MINELFNIFIQLIAASFGDVAAFTVGNAIMFNIGGILLLPFALFANIL